MLNIEFFSHNYNFKYWLIRIPKICFYAISFLSLNSVVFADEDEKRSYSKTQFGVSGLAYWSTADPFVNALKQNGTASLDWNHKLRQNKNLAFSELVQRGYFDLSTNRFCGPLPKGSYINLGFVRGAAKSAPDYFSGKWVVTWTGDAQIKVGLGGSKRQKVTGKNRLEFTALPKDSWTSVRITRIGKRCVGDIQAFRAEDEDLLPKGQVFRDHYRSFVGQFDVVRTMAWSASNDSHIRSVNELTPWSAPFWASRGNKPLVSNGPFTYEPSRRPIDHSVFASAPLKLHFRLAKESGVAIWLNVPPMLGRPTFPGDVDWSDWRAFKYVDEAKKPEIAQATLSSEEWRKYADAVVAQLIEEDYPRDKMLYLEIGNEIWNWAGHFARHTGHFQGLGSYLKQSRPDYPGGEPLRVAYGYVSAMFAEIFSVSLKKAERKQRWKMVIATHTAWPEARLRHALEGLKWYNRNIASTPEATSRFVYSTTSYFSGGFHWSKDNQLFGKRFVDKKDWVDRWLLELQKNPEALARRIETYLLNVGAKPNNVAYVLQKHAANKQVADSYGIEFLGDYEGSSHDDIRDRRLKQNSAATAFYKRWYRSKRAARVQEAMNSALIKQAPDALIADFVRFSAQKQAFNPWAEQNDPDDVTPLSKYWSEFLRN